MLKTKDTIPPKSPTGKACAYLYDQWNILQTFLQDGRLDIDTNWIENRIRPFCVGRKNWLFAQTPSGAESSAIIYSLIETCKLQGVEPDRYLKHVFAALPYAQTLDDLEKLVPSNQK